MGMVVARALLSLQMGLLQSLWRMRKANKYNRRQIKREGIVHKLTEIPAVCVAHAHIT